MENEAKVKDIAIQLTNLAIVNYNDKTLTGEQREHKVCQFLAGLTDMIPMVSWIPNEIIADGLDIGWDNVQAYLDTRNPIDWVKKQYQRIKHIFKKK